MPMSCLQLVAVQAAKLVTDGDDDDDHSLFFNSNTLLWLHTTFAFLYLLLTVYSMRRHTSKMHYREDDLVGSPLMSITNHWCGYHLRCVCD